MTFIEQQQSPMMAIIRPSSMNISPNEFYDSAIELVADDYSSSTTSYCDPYLSTTSTKHTYNQSNNCIAVTSSSSSAINRLTNLVYTNPNNQSLNTLVFNPMYRTKFNGNDSKRNQQPVLFDQQRIDSSISTLKSSPKSSTLSKEIIPKQKSSHQTSSSLVISNNRTLSMMATNPQQPVVVISSDNQKYQPQSSSTAINTSYKDNRENRIHSATKYQPQQQINTNIKKQITIQQQPLPSISSSSSPLRSSRSFTASYCSRPNVTLIRRKSASERLAESKGKYIGRMPSDMTINRFINQSDRLDYGERQSPFQSIVQMETSTATSLIRSKQTTNSLSNSLITEIHHGSNNSDNRSLITKINSHLNKIKKQSDQNNLVKKRISPKLSENSTGGTSNLELQLRELISLDNMIGETIQPNRISKDVIITKNDDPRSNCESDDLIIQQNDIYRAELKYIGSSSSSSSSSSHSSSSATQSTKTTTTTTSSSSSLCSIFSEPYNISSSPEKMKRINDELLLSSSSLKKENKFTNFPSQLPSICDDWKQEENLNLSTSVMRSKSDISPLSNNQRFLNNHSNPKEQDIDRLFKNLCLNSNLQQNNNDNRMETKRNERNISFSSNDDSMKRKMHHHTNNNKDNYNVKNHHNNEMIYPSYDDSNSSKSTISNEFSSFNSSSQLSVDEPSFSHTHNSKRRRIFHHHGGSTSKLTFENLMLHQQNLASSRSCTNLLANFHNGPSVVERNARIIKWLFNCRKAMDHQSTII
ncbi:uncharacterized protein LOC124492155 [Dermatophagoides farinae]|uniref:uncharacterized protein LOC124492155 n=1 Tax=Dermatophagoides farinae TaxID=6954 RepID=UPI003F639E09